MAGLVSLSELEICDFTTEEDLRRWVKQVTEVNRGMRRMFEDAGETLNTLLRFTTVTNSTKNQYDPRNEAKVRAGQIRTRLFRAAEAQNTSFVEVASAMAIFDSTWGVPLATVKGRNNGMKLQGGRRSA